MNHSVAEAVSENYTLEKSVRHKAGVFISKCKDERGSHISIVDKKLILYQIFNWYDYAYSTFLIIILIGLLIIFMGSFLMQAICILGWFFLFKNEVFIPISKGVYFEFDIPSGVIKLTSGLKRKTSEINILELDNYKFRVTGGSQNKTAYHVASLSRNKDKYILGYFWHGYVAQNVIVFLNEASVVYKYWDSYGKSKKVISNKLNESF